MITNIVFLDTSIILNENFLRGHKLKRLGELSKKGFLEVKITDIIYNEVKNRIIKDLITSKSIIKRINRELDVDARILKNFGEFLPQFPIITVDKEKLADDLQKRFDDFINESKIEIVSSEIASIKEVFDAYTKILPPFSEGKRHEFPDAFILNTISHWCENNAKKVYVISADGDFKKFVDEKGNIIPYKDLAEFLDMVNKEFISGEKLKLITRKIADSTDSVKQYFHTYAEDIGYKIYEDIRWNYEEAEYEVLEIKQIHSDEIYITETSDKEASAQFDITVYFTMDLFYDDLDSAYYDKEDDRYYNVQQVSETLEVRAQYLIDTEFTFEFDNNSELIDFDLDWQGNLQLANYEILNSNEY